METKIKERPILLNGPMVRAVLGGVKTRLRILAPEFKEENDLDEILRRHPNQKGCPLGEVGGRLWVKETFGFNHHAAKAADVLVYRADHEGAKVVTSPWSRTRTYQQAGQKIEYSEDTNYWHPSTRMTRANSRILLEITSVQVKRLQSMTSEGAVAEGIETIPHPACPDYKSWKNYLDKKSHCPHPIDSYGTLWKKLHGADSWDANPWAWVIEFKVISPAPTPTTQEGGSHAL